MEILAVIAVAAAMAVAAIACLIRSAWERRQLSVETYHIVSDKLKKNHVFVFLSDLHDQSFGKDNEDLIKAVKEVQPEAVFVGGDTMVCKKNCDITKSVALLTALAGCFPVYHGNGNHETRMERERKKYGNVYDVYMAHLLKAGICLLKDSSAMIDEVRITGIDIEEPYYHNVVYKTLTAEDIERKAGMADREHFQILLSHSPLFFKAYRQWGADLSLTGHFHGGTIRLPVLGGVMTPQYQFFCRYCAGRFDKDNKTMIVSRGLGTHSINIRINNKPQLVVIRLETKED